jgi:hypothetical protein
MATTEPPAPAGADLATSVVDIAMIHAWWAGVR